MWSKVRCGEVNKFLWSNLGFHVTSKSLSKYSKICRFSICFYLGDLLLQTFQKTLAFIPPKFIIDVYQWLSVYKGTKEYELLFR